MLELHRFQNRGAFFSQGINSSRAAWLADDLRVAEGLSGRNAIDGTCALCDRSTEFKLVGGDGEPNWRESQTCEPCGLISRVRFAFLLAGLSASRRQHSIYMTEQTTPAFFWLRKKGFNVVGSEFVEESPRREMLSHYIKSMTDGLETRLRHEDVTRLSFGNDSFERLFSFDVLEHIPNHRAALREFWRVLRPGGLAVITVPFDVNAEASLVRASVAPDGSIAHHVTPEYHGDPVADKGCLAFHTFSWELLENLRSAGFANVELALGRDTHGGLRGLQLAILASKAAS